MTPVLHNDLFNVLSIFLIFNHFVNFPMLHIIFCSFFVLRFIIFNPVFEYTCVPLERSFFRSRCYLFVVYWDFFFSFSDLTLIKEGFWLEGCVNFTLFVYLFSSLFVFLSSPQSLLLLNLCRILIFD